MFAKQMRWILPAAALVVTGAPALAEKSVEADVTLGAALRMNVETSGCSNRGGPYIKLDGDVFNGGLAGKLRAQNASGVHSDEVDAVLSAKLTDAFGKSITIPKQPPEKFDGGGAGGNPWIWFEATDKRGDAVAPAVLLGRCVQGLFNVNALFKLVGHAKGNIDGSCKNHPGPYITIDGSLIVGGIDGNIIFTNQDSLDAVHRRDVAGKLTFEIVPDGGGVVWPKQPFKDIDGDGEGDGVTGNPLLFFTFTDTDGLGMSREYRLGRCNKL
jgi:hypothetical protein